MMQENKKNYKMGLTKPQPHVIINTRDEGRQPEEGIRKLDK